MMRMMRSWLTFRWEPTFWLCASPIGWDSRGWLRNLRRDYFCTAARLFNEPGLQLPLRRLWSTFQTQKWLWTGRVWLCRRCRGDVEGRELCSLETLGRSHSLPVNWLSTASSLHAAVRPVEDLLSEKRCWCWCCSSDTDLCLVLPSATLLSRSHWPI